MTFIRMICALFRWEPYITATESAWRRGVWPFRQTRSMTPDERREYWLTPSHDRPMRRPS